MSTSIRRVALIALILALGGCNLFPALTQPTPTSGPPTATLPPTPTQFIPTTNPPAPTATLPSTPTESAACLIVGGGEDVIVYFRPSTEADQFAPLANAGFPLQATARTAEGWLGFDPGVAQAANIGVFRLRWVQEAEVQTEGPCADLPVVTAPHPTACYTMPMDDTPVYSAPDAASTVIVTLHVEQYAAVIGLSSSGWAQVDLAIGNSGASGLGWVMPETLNFNGPCDALPTVEP